MDCLRLLTALVFVTPVACWADPFNWHFLPNHYRLYSTHTVDHTVRFDTDCGTLAADSGATHFLWDPESGFCAVSSGLTAAELLVGEQQDSKSSFYYVRDFALVVPPGNRNCPTEAQLKRMIDNLRSLNGSFSAEPDPTRRTWRDECKKDEHSDAMDTTTTASIVSPTTNSTKTANVTSLNTPVMSVDTTLPRKSSSTVNIRVVKTDSSSAVPVTSTRSTTVSARMPPVPPAAVAPAPLPMIDASGSVSDGVLTNAPITALTASKTTSSAKSDKTMGEHPVTTTYANTPLVITARDSPAASSTTDGSSTVPNIVTHSPSTSATSIATTASAAMDTTTEGHSITTTSSVTPSKSTASGSPVAATKTAWSTTDNHSAVSNAIIHIPLTTTTSAHTTTLKNTDATTEKESITTTSIATTTSPAGTAPRSATSDSIVDKTTSTSSTSKRHSDTITPISPTAVTVPRETTTKNDPEPTPSPAKPNLVTEILSRSTSSAPTRKSTTPSSDSMTTNTTTSTVPPSSATAAATGSVGTTKPNGETKRLASTASSTVRARSTTKVTTTKRLTTPTPAKTTKRTTARTTIPNLWDSNFGLGLRG